MGETLHLRAIRQVWKKIKNYGKVRPYTSVECTIDTRQACVASPILLLLFINDLITYLCENCGNGLYVSQEAEDLFILLVADDVAGFFDHIGRLQSIIDRIAIFCDIVGMKLNPEKTKIVVFRNDGPPKEIEKCFINTLVCILRLS